MCNVLPNRRMAFTVLLSVLVVGCGIKWATNKVLTNRSAIEQVGAVYDALTPKDTTERLVFIQGDSIFTEHTDTLEITDTIKQTDTIRITKVQTIRRTDTIIRTLPPDNRGLNRINDSLALYRAKVSALQGEAKQYEQQAKRAEKRLIWFAAGVLVMGVIIGLLLKFKIYPKI